MKIEIRQVQEIYYIAEDGKEFKDQYDCLNYEQSEKMGVIENWIEVNNKPKKNTQCRCKTPDGIDKIGQYWFDGSKWWNWEQGSGLKFGMKEGYITHYIPLFERISF